ncbi:DUF3016 domain-containing protein [Aliidiomarina halalkaliphila]|uniref:DUF3016 domain-containing protein n=1 Tax=Aliidiomarina halalkaliphila TaxID=2593535 RepID=A0A552X0F3_9GAMM|nr:DUF3016 domain-containing protein [Aliidiomarina halalkaliphila]TRW48527.1 DUF3016 domain-containing protein [Aliidiomarina halalkaliphila]
MKALWIALITSTMFVSVAVNAADVKVTWQDPSSYRDIQAADMQQARFQEQLFAAFESKFESLAADLPDGYTLSIIVTDVMLAGLVEMHDLQGQPKQMRVIRPGYYPEMKLTYSLVDADGNEVQAGDEHIRGRELFGQGRLESKQRRRGVELIEYEGAMLDRWFKNTFKADD